MTHKRLLLEARYYDSLEPEMRKIYKYLNKRFNELYGIDLNIEYTSIIESVKYLDAESEKMSKFRDETLELVRSRGKMQRVEDRLLTKNSAIYGNIPFDEMGINNTVFKMFNDYENVYENSDVIVKVQNLLKKIGPKSRFDGRIQLPKAMNQYDKRTEIDSNTLGDFAYAIVEFGKLFKFQNLHNKLTPYSGKEVSEYAGSQHPQSTTSDPFYIKYNTRERVIIDKDGNIVEDYSQLDKNALYSYKDVQDVRIDMFDVNQNISNKTLREGNEYYVNEFLGSDKNMGIPLVGQSTLYTRIQQNGNSNEIELNEISDNIDLKFDLDDSLDKYRLIIADGMFTASCGATFMAAIQDHFFKKEEYEGFNFSHSDDVTRMSGFGAMICIVKSEGNDKFKLSEEDTSGGDTSQHPCYVSLIGDFIITPMFHANGRQHLKTLLNHVLIVPIHGQNNVDYKIAISASGGFGTSHVYTLLNKVLCLSKVITAERLKLVPQNSFAELMRVYEQYGTGYTVLIDDVAQIVPASWTSEVVEKVYSLYGLTANKSKQSISDDIVYYYRKATYIRDGKILMHQVFPNALTNLYFKERNSIKSDNIKVISNIGVSDNVFMDPLFVTKGGYIVLSQDKRLMDILSVGGPLGKIVEFATIDLAGISKGEKGLYNPSVGSSFKQRKGGTTVRTTAHNLNEQDLVNELGLSYSQRLLDNEFDINGMFINIFIDNMSIKRLSPEEAYDNAIEFIHSKVNTKLQAISNLSNKLSDLLKSTKLLKYDRL